MNCIVISQSSKQLTGYIASAGDLTLDAVYNNMPAAIASKLLQQTDLVFLEMDKTDPELLSSVPTGPQVILITSSPNYAVEAFNIGIADYLLKPFPFERFRKAVDRVGKLKASVPEHAGENSPDYFFVKSDNKFERINRKDILYIESLQNYIIIQTTGKKVVTYSSLKSIENYLCEKEFLRVQRSFIVSISKIDRIDSEDVIIGATSIRISRAIRENVLNTILHNRLYTFHC